MINYSVEGNGEAILFIHGLSDNLHYWDVLANNLKNDYKIIRYDLRGHGESPLDDDDLTIDTYTNDLYNLLEELSINRVKIVAFSLGGLIALNFTIKHPEKVSSLILMSSFAKCTANQKNIFNMLKDALNNGFEDYFDSILPMVYCPKFVEDNHEEFEIVKEYAASIVNVQAFIKAIDVCLTTDLEKELFKINAPTLILAGEYDMISPLTTQENIKNNIDNSKLIVLKDVKHNLLVGKNVKIILDILKNFFSEQKPS